MSGKKLSIAEQRERAKQWALEEEKKKRQREDKPSPNTNVTGQKNKRAKLTHTPPAVQAILPNNNNNNNKRASTSSPINNRNNRITTAEEIDSPPKRRGRPPSPKSTLEDSIKIQQELVRKRAEERTNVILNENQGRGRNLTPSEKTPSTEKVSRSSKKSTTEGIIEKLVSQRTPISQRNNITTKSSRSENLENELQANFRETYNNAERQKSLSKNLAQVRKKEGNLFYKKENYIEAIDKYSAAIELDETDISFYSNRSACNLALQRFELAVEDGRKCLKLDKNYLKGYYRTGLGLIGLEKYEAALNILQQGLDLDPNNPELLKIVKDLKNHMAETDETTTTLLIVKNYNTDISPNPYEKTPQENRRFIREERSQINEPSIISILLTKLKILLIFLLSIPFSSLRNALSTAFLIISIYLYMTYGKEIIQTSFYMALSSPVIVTFYLYRRFRNQTSEKVKATQQVVETLADIAKEELAKVHTSNGYYPVELLKWSMYTAVNEAIQENIIPLTPMNTVLKYNKDRNYSKNLIGILWKDIIKEVEKDPNIQPSTRDYEGKISKCWKIAGIRGRSPFPSFSSSSSSPGMFSSFFLQKERSRYH